ncbi:B114 [miniopterid betaherpesvirus 1]|uniref:B114 n=1 Tax=miniopterid betaherpesvirus 1 TaxID=3070189 RepID=I3VQA4_9BETA|nr:B114 [miniopterid betaherpesvirus 1]AFK83948.1 B114 [miniopterid betaherpesvirus 1]
MALRTWMLENIMDDSRKIASSTNPADQAKLLGIDIEWLRFLQLDDVEFGKIKGVHDAVTRDRYRYVVYPAPENVHRWSRLCRPGDVKAVIVGQDPYHDGSACGLAFGTVPGGKIPPSLGNIYKELTRSIVGFIAPSSGCLDAWCKEGVLLINSVFTVIKGKPGSHETLGWQLLCDKVIASVSKNNENVVFMLWGKHAQEKEYLIDGGKHLILKSSHPSPRVTSTRSPFVGNGHFATANEYLSRRGDIMINWCAICERQPDM